MNQRGLREYWRLRAKCWPAKDAIRAARAYSAFVELERRGLVELRAVSEEEQYDASYVDTWTDISEKRRKAAKDDIMRRVAEEGVYTLISLARATEEDEFECVDSCGGFIGEDWKDSGHDVDLMIAALEHASASLH